MDATIDLHRWAWCDIDLIGHGLALLAKGLPTEATSRTDLDGQKTVRITMTYPLDGKTHTRTLLIPLACLLDAMGATQSSRTGALAETPRKMYAAGHERQDKARAGQAQRL